MNEVFILGSAIVALIVSGYMIFLVICAIVVAGIRARSFFNLDVTYSNGDAFAMIGGTLLVYSVLVGGWMSYSGNFTATF